MYIDNFLIKFDIFFKINEFIIKSIYIMILSSSNTVTIPKINIDVDSWAELKTYCTKARDLEHFTSEIELKRKYVTFQFNFGREMFQITSFYNVKTCTRFFWLFSNVKIS